MQARVISVSLMALVATSCSGDDVARGVTSTTVSTVTIAPTTAETTTPSTSLPSTMEVSTTVSPPATTEVRTDPPPATNTAFCTPAADVFVGDAASELMVDPAPAEVEALLEFMAFATIDMLDNAPGDWALRSEALLTALSEFDIALSEFEYDIAAARAGDVADRITDAASVIDETVDELGVYLEADCGKSHDALVAEAGALLDFLRDDGSTVDGSTGGGLTTATDDSGRIRVDLPSDWAVDGSALDDAIQLTAGLDPAALDESWLVDAVRITAFDVEPGTADPDRLLEFSSAPAGCELVSTEPYSDVLYAGEIRSYAACGGADVFAFVVTVADFDQATEISIEGRFADPDDQNFTYILDSFIVDPAS